jgi:hypothetical protein
MSRAEPGPPVARRLMPRPAPRGSPGFDQCKRAAVIEIGRLMDGDELDDGGPEPGGRVDALHPGGLKLLPPCVARRLVHLAAMGPSNDAGQIAGEAHGFLPRQPVDFDLQILGHQLAQHHRGIQEACGDHAIAEIGRKRPSTLDDAKPLRSRVSNSVS